MLNEKTTTNTEVSAIVSRTFPTARQPKKEDVCEHCKKPRHTAETCWDLHGKPPDWKPNSFETKGRGGSRAYLSGIENQDNAEKPSGTASFSKEQLDQLYKLFQSAHFSNSSTVPASCSLAQLGNHLHSIVF